MSREHYTEAEAAPLRMADALERIAERVGGLDVERLWRVLSGIGVIENGTWVSFRHEDAVAIARKYAEED